MADEITCSRCGETRAAISGRVPFRADLKERVLSQICETCWAEWLEEQVKIINELALNLGDPRSHEVIEQKAREHLGLSEGEATAD